MCFLIFRKAMLDLIVIILFVGVLRIGVIINEFIFRIIGLILMCDVE